MSYVIRNRLLSLLPNEGEKSKRAFALFCAERVAHLNPNPRVAKCLAVVRQKVVKPESVTRAKLRTASEGAYASTSFISEGVYAITNFISSFTVYHAGAAAYYAAYDAAASDDTATVAAAYAADAAANAAATVHADYNTERKVQLDYLLSLAMTQFYPGYWANREMFEETGEIFISRGCPGFWRVNDDFVSIRKITDENALVALDYFLEKRKVLPLRGLGCWCR